MRINLAGWSSEGLRCPDVSVDFRVDGGAPAHVALVQMPNGTGKTTTLTLLKATLSGEGAGWDASIVRSMRRKDDARTSGQFVVKLLIDGRPLTIELALDFESGRATCRTTNPGSGGIVNKWSPPPSVRRFLNRAFLNLFIFDGELASDLFKPGQTKAEDAIDALCQLYLLGDVADFADKEWDRKAAGRAGPKSASALSGLKQKRDDLLARVARVERVRTAAVDRMAVARAAIEELERKIAERIAGLEDTKAAFADAQLKLVTANGDVTVATSALLRSLRLPLALDPAIGTSLVRLKENLDALRLPQATSAQFFADLVKEPECICGNTMSEAMRFEIRERAKLVLGSEEAGAINAIKHDIENYRPGKDELPPHEGMRKNLAELSVARRGQLEADQAVRTLKRKLIEGGDDQLKDLEEQREAYDKDYGAGADILASVDDPDEDARPIDQMYSLSRLRGELESVKDKISEATETVELRAKTAIIRKVVERSERIARQRIKAELLRACNERLGVILANDPVQLASIDGCLRLAGQERGSVGQTLTVGYTFLMTLLERGDNRFPLVVDSPVGSMDGTLRRRVGRLVPTLCTQFVAFTINTERAEFIPALEAGATSIRYLTQFRKTDGTRRLMRDLPQGGFAETGDGVLVDDKAYFDSFDIEDEP